MLRTLAFPLAALAGATALAGTACPQHFAAGQPPVVTNPRLEPRTQEICFRAFAVLHSGVSRAPLYAAEYLTRKNVRNAGNCWRTTRRARGERMWTSRGI
jgi:endonuclease G